MALQKVNSKGFNCIFYSMSNNKLFANSNKNCWRGIEIYNTTKNNVDIYIDDYQYEETEQYIPLIVKTINEITPCEIVTIDDKEYIKFRLLNHYDKSLLLLNWIRLLWFSPRCDTYKDDITTSINFFESLKKRKEECYFVRLIMANIESQKHMTLLYSNGHSNVVDTPERRSNLKVKTLEDFNKFSGDNYYSIRTFLTT